MNIALIHYRLLHKGGLETRLINYIQYFSDQNHQITLFCAKISNEIIVPKGLQIIKVRLGLMPKVFRKWYFNFKLSKLIKNYYFDFSLSLGRTACQDAVLAPSNHLGYLIAFNKTHTSLSDKIQIYLDKISYQKSKIIFACSEMMKNELKKLYHIDENKIKILYPPLNLTKFPSDLKKDQKTLKNLCFMDTEALCFLFVSNDHKRKGFDLLQQIFQKLDARKYKLYVVGDATNTGKSSNILYLGYSNDLAKYYAAADFTIHPAIYEPFGQIITESLQMQTPVIVSGMVGAKEILNKKVGIVVESDNCDSWIKILETLRPEDFSIPENFITQHNLSLEYHAEKMLKTWERMQKKEKLND